MANAFIPYGAGERLAVDFQFRRCHLVLSAGGSLTRSFIRHLSAARFTMMPAAALSPPQLDEVIAKEQVQFAMERHGDGHIGEESVNARHFLLQCSMRKL